MPPPLVFAGATVYDGGGEPPQVCDVYVGGGLIERVAAASDLHPGARVIDAGAYALAPGFIDVHSHGDNAPFCTADDTSKILQGVTTEVVGNCGISIAPYDPAARDTYFARLHEFFPGVPAVGPRFADVLAHADRCGYVTNYAPLAGHGNVRSAAMGGGARRATPAEVSAMRALVREALEAGAFGLSTGLIYPPGMFADTEELVALAAELGEEHIFTSHIRGEGDGLIGSVDEIIRIGRRTARRVHVSHHKAAGPQNWGASRTTLQMLAGARAAGVAISQDVYPYRAGSTSLTALLPPRYHDGGPPATLERLRGAGAARDIGNAIAAGEPGWENFARGAGWDGILISTTADHRFEGRTLAQVAVDLGIDPAAALVRVLLEEELAATMIVSLMDEPDIERILADAHTSIGTDGAPPGTGGKPHPRTFGAFPRVLGEYVRERRVLSLEAAIRRMTSLAAETFGIADRGRIVAGAAADLVLFDPATIADSLDYLQPSHTPAGIRMVVVAGRIVAESGRYLGGRAGRRLRPRRP